MSMNMINLTIIGRVVADPTVETANEKEVTKFRVILNRDINGENKPLTFSCSAYNGLNKIAQYLKKGRLVCITANDLQQHPWSADGKSGVNNYIIVNSITILDKKPADNSESQTSNNVNFDSEEIPF
jgi:single-stranded DNA-binding protein